jgi:hypothetical protein
MTNAEGTFRTDLESLVNRYAREAGSGTPDFILADHMMASLELFDRTTNMRDQWWGFDPKIGGAIPAKGPDAAGAASLDP